MIERSPLTSSCNLIEVQVVGDAGGVSFFLRGARSMWLALSHEASLAASLRKMLRTMGESFFSERRRR